jgi:hypothetical protein
MSAITPSWTDQVSVLAATTISNGGLSRATLDLRTKYGAFLFAMLGRKGTTTPGAAIKVFLRRVLNDGTAGPAIAPVYAPLLSNLNTTNQSTINADAAAAATSIVVASGTGFAAGDTICIYDASFTRLEFKTVSKVSGTTITLCEPLDYAHTAAQADNVSRQADVFGPIWCGGGSLWEVIFDYGGTATGSDVVVICLAQTFDSQTIA